MHDYLLQLNDIHFSRSQREILSGVNLELNQGEIVTLIGPNGAGKSSLLKIALGLQKPDRGSVVRRPALRIGYMPQKLQIPETLPLTVLNFLQLARDYNPAHMPAVAQRLNIEHLLGSQFNRLSGGEHQRVLLARALLAKPQLLVLDEPVQGLDVGGQAELYALIADLKNELPAGILMVSHDLHLVMAATDRVICLNQHVCCEGHPSHVSQDPNYLRLFGQRIPAELAPYTHHHDHQHDHIHGPGCSHEHGPLAPLRQHTGPLIIKEPKA